MTTRHLLHLNIGEVATIKGFSDQEVAVRLLTIGIVPTALISIIRRSPLGDAVYLRLGKTLIAIRNQEARCVVIE